MRMIMKRSSLFFSLYHSDVKSFLFGRVTAGGLAVAFFLTGRGAPRRAPSDL